MASKPEGTWMSGLGRSLLALPAFVLLPWNQALMDPAVPSLAVTSLGLAGTRLSCLLDFWNSLKLRTAQDLQSHHTCYLGSHLMIHNY